MTASTLFLVRHGQTAVADDRFVGSSDVTLSSQGENAMRRLARSWTRPAPAVVVASDLSRATTSAQILARHWNRPVSRDPRLQELDFGDWEGKSWQQVRRDDNVRLDAWLADWVNHTAPNGESFTDLARRAGGWLDETLDSGVTPLVTVAHGGSIRALLCEALQLPLEMAFRFKMDHAHVTVLTGSRECMDAVCINAKTFQ